MMGPRREGESAASSVSSEKHFWPSVPDGIILETNRPRVAVTTGGTTPKDVASMCSESSTPGQRQGHKVSEPMDGEPEWVTEARELRRTGLSFKRVAEKVGQVYGTVHYWVAPTGGATKRNRLGHARKTVVCAECGEEFTTSASRLAAGAKYCSPRCFHAEGRRTPEGTRAASEKMRTQRMGRGNPQYRHGLYAGKKTKELEREFNLRKKGETACRNCGIDRPGTNAHHAVPRSLSPSGRLDLRNCLPLCPRCHARWHRGVPILRDRFTAEEWAFVETLIGSSWLDRKYPVPEGEWEFRSC